MTTGDGEMTTTPTPDQIEGRHRTEPRIRPRTWWILLVGALAILAVALRTWQLVTYPGWEWDEPVYTSVAANLASTGVLEPKQWVGADGPYLYHPPFYFYLLASWFSVAGEASVETARCLAAAGAVLTLALVGVMTSRQPGGKGGVVVLATVAFDGWIIFTNRTGLIENPMFPIGVAGVLVYQWAAGTQHCHRVWGYTAAGALIGAAAVFKHTGAYMLAVPIIHWLVVRRDLRHHLVLLSTAAGVVGAYLVGMSLRFGEVFWSQYRIQALRSLGLAESRGSVALSDLGAAAGAYWPFIPTVMMAAFSLGVLVVRTLIALRQRNREVLAGETSVYYAWAVASVIFFAALGIRLPQYMMLALIPLYLYAGSETILWLRQRGESRSIRTVGTLAVLLMVAGVGVASFTARVSATGRDALREGAEYVAEKYGPAELVLTEEPIGVAIPQSYIQFDAWAQMTQPPAPALVVTVTSLTQQPPTSAELDQLLSEATEVFSVTGFKETVTVHQVERP